MHYAIIAAGEGSRLREEGLKLPKPLVPISGEPMIDRLMAIMCHCGAESISVICRSEMPEVCQHLSDWAVLHPDIPLHLVTGSTPSSMHSLGLLSQVIPEGKVCVTTVDTIFRPDEFAAYVKAFSQQPEGGLFVVTPFVDDEKPLWVEPADPLPAAGAVTFPIGNFCDHESELPEDEPRYVSGGIYGLDTRTAWPVLRDCLAQGQSRMRNFQRALIAAGVPLTAYVLPKVMDIDHATDISKAEQWLSSRPILAITRAPEHSPNHVASDAAILRSVVEGLQRLGYPVRVIAEDDLRNLSPRQVSDEYAAVIHMARRLASLTRLSQLAVPVFNRPQGVTTVSQSRELTLTLLRQAGVQVPDWWAYDPEEDEMFQCEPRLQQLLPGWVKAMRADGARPTDVTWVETPLQADSCIIELSAESVPDIVVTHHVEGDLLKVYCVGDRCWTFYPQEQGYSKFGDAERHNTPLRHTAVRAERLKSTAEAVARTFGLQVFGFDAIVSPDGNLVVIDVNDWPSFSSCREEAASAIVSLVNGSLAE